MSPVIFIFAFFASLVMSLGTVIRTPEFEKARFIPIAASVLCIGLIAALGLQWVNLQTPLIQMVVIAIVANMVTIALKAVYAVETTSSVPVVASEPAVVATSETVSPVTSERKKPVVAIDKTLFTKTTTDQGGTRLIREKTLAEAEA
jgi:hypothetical protein